VSDRARGFRRGAAAPPPPAPPAELARSLDGGGFVFFDSPDAWRQALAFEEALRPSIPRRARPCVD
ncbi:MAG TPA: hypothetical protein VNI01_14665, partial [Elusimicrobiota bacterium]|nr:hypothetical protein [Elusimicrobiota bacterium]